MGRRLGYFGFIYLLIIGAMIVSYPFAQEYAQPVASLIFPINPDTSLVRNLLVVSGMYWGMVVIFTKFVNRS